MPKSDDAFRTISEVAEEVGVPQHVLRFWETKFAAVKPLKRGGGRRYYRPEDVSLLLAINRLLYTDGLTIKGVQKLLKERGAKGLVEGVTGAMVSGGSALMPASRKAAADTASSSKTAAAVPAETDALMLRELRAIRDRLSGALDAARI